MYDVTKLKTTVTVIFDRLKHSLVARWFPRVGEMIGAWETKIDSELDGIASKLPPTPTWLQIVDAVIGALEVAFPSEKLMLDEVKTLLNWIFGNPPPLPG